MRDHFAQISARAALFAVSYEDAKTEAGFRANFHFPFPLLSDPGYRVIDHYGGREPNGIYAKPAAFVINPQGMVTWSYIGNSPADRPPIETLLKAL